jgi:hypothetical protein
VSLSQLQVFGLMGLAAVVIAAGLWIVLRSLRSSPEKRERNRRAEVHRHGRLGEAFVTDANESSIYYEYSVNGVHYTASQDISALRDRLPTSPERLTGVANLKYAARNPANSILICEEWSGLRPPASAAIR